MSDIQGKVFADFNPPATSDGSYRGRKKVADANKEHFHMKLVQELQEVNQRLKSSKTKVSVESSKGGLQLRATLPIKPGDTVKTGRKKKQYKISLGIPANFDGLKTAEEEAYELGKLIARQTFTWTDKYLGVKATKEKGITFEGFYEQFEKRYFETRKRTRKSEGTFENYKSKYKRFFLSDLRISKITLRESIKKIEKPMAREEAIRIASLIKSILKLDCDFSDLRLKHEKRKRDIPNDEDIIFYIENFQQKYQSSKNIAKSIRHKWKLYKLAYGLLATYGLRPREIANKPDFDWLLSPENIHDTFKVNSDNKTGYREVFPFVPGWVNLFDLKNVEAIDYLKQEFSKCTSSYELKMKIDLISNNFKRSKIPFQPYDLRHACAIRAHLQGMPIKAAADNLGHSVEMHTKVYQQWFGLENRRKAFEQTFEGISELEKIKDENTRLINEVTELKLELSRYQLLDKEK